MYDCMFYSNEASEEVSFSKFTNKRIITIRLRQWWRLMTIAVVAEH